MRFIVVGLNEQGLQRQSVLGADCVALVNSIQEISINSYDAVFICCANENKYSAVRYALVNKKHVLLQAPLWVNNLSQIEELEQLAAKNKVVFYTAYTYRFVHAFSNLQQMINDYKLGDIQHCRLAFYANDINKCNGALLDLAPHLLDLLGFWFKADVMQGNFSIVHKDPFGRQVIFADFNATCTFEIEANFFDTGLNIGVEIFGTRDTLRINYTHDVLTDEMQLEHAHFLRLCGQARSVTDCVMDKWIYTELDRLSSEQMLLA